MRRPFITAVSLLLATLLPGKAATLQMQLIASNYTDGATWTDSSGMGNNATRGGTPTRVLGATPTGGAVVRFNGTTDLFSLPNFASGFTSGEAFVVVRIDNDPPSGGGQTGLWKFGTAGANMHYTWTDGNIYDSFGSTGRPNMGNPTQDLTQFHIYHVRSESGFWESRINNVVHYSSASNTVGFRSDPYLGRSNGGFYLDGEIAEFRFYEGTLTAGERDTIFNSLNGAYIIPEPSAPMLMGVAGILLALRRRSR